MVKTRKHRTSTFHTKPCCEATMHGLNEWYKSEFEKLGWMILAKSRGMTDKIAMYKTTLNHLLSSLEHKLGHLKDSDKKQDIHIMIHNVKILINHVNKDFYTV